MRAEIITIGDELLIGQVIDTNSAFIAQELNKAGFKVQQISSISDTREHILKALPEAESRADIIILTGGLGPTRDDITKSTLAEYFGSTLIVNEAALDNVKRIFEKYKRPILPVNFKQAEVPNNCTVLLNENGTAPCMYFQKNKKHYFSLPGVPFEMMALISDKIIPLLKKEFALSKILHKTVLLAGAGESFIAELLTEIEDNLPTNFKLAYLPKLGQIRLRLSCYDYVDLNKTEKDFEEWFQKITDILQKYIVIEQDVSIHEAVLKALEKNGKTLSLAESCTGGYMSHLLTSIPGSSKVFAGGAVSYSYALKEIMLEVKEETLMKYGAVSEEVVMEMLQGALQNFQSDYAIACSGIAGPDGGTADKPVGTVWIAVGNKEKMICKKYLFSNKRMQNIERTAVKGFEMLFKLIKNEM